jgi:hypothetical protein
MLSYSQYMVAFQCISQLMKSVLLLWGMNPVCSKQLLLILHYSCNRKVGPLLLDISCNIPAHFLCSLAYVGGTMLKNGKVLAYQYFAA